MDSYNMKRLDSLNFIIWTATKNDKDKKLDIGHGDKRMVLRDDNYSSKLSKAEAKCVQTIGAALVEFQKFLAADVKKEIEKLL